MYCTGVGVRLTHEYAEEFERFKVVSELGQERTGVLGIAPGRVLETQRAKGVWGRQQEHGFGVRRFVDDGDVANGGVAEFLKVREQGLERARLDEGLQNGFMDRDSSEPLETTLRHDGSDAFRVLHCPSPMSDHGFFLDCLWLQSGCVAIKAGYKWARTNVATAIWSLGAKLSKVGGKVMIRG